MWVVVLTELLGVHDQADTKLSSFEAHREFMRADWTFLHPTIFQEHVFESAIKMKLTRQLDSMTDALAEEAGEALDALAERSSTGVISLSNHQQWKKIVLQTISRIYVGPALCELKLSLSKHVHATHCRDRQGSDIFSQRSHFQRSLNAYSSADQHSACCA